MKIAIKLRTKLLLAVLSVVLLAYTLSTLMQLENFKDLNLKYANEVAISASKEFSAAAYNTIDSKLSWSKVLSDYSSKQIQANTSDAISSVKRILEENALKNPDYQSVWASLELRFITPSYTNNYGRVRLNYYRDEKGDLKYKQDTLDLKGDNIGSLYHTSKVNKIAVVSDPYWFSYTGKDSLLETSIGSPIIIRGEFAGLLGFDLSLKYFQRTLNEYKSIKGAKTFLISSNGSVVADKDSSARGHKIGELYKGLSSSDLTSVLTSLKGGHSTSLTYKNGESGKVVFTVIPISFKEAKTNWGFGMQISEKELVGNNKGVRNIWLAALATIVLVVIMMIIISHQITRPLIKVNKALKDLSLGRIDEKNKIKVTTNDELKDIATSTNTLIDSLNQTVEFAKEVGKGNLSVSFEPKSSDDILGIALLDMKKNLEEAKKLEALRKIEDEKINWATKGVAFFGELLRHNETDLEEFSYRILSNLIDYIKADVGGLFLVKEQEDGSKTIDLMASYAFDRRKFEEKSLLIGEGLVGRCVQESETIFLTEIPNGYISIGSGLGENSPTCILIVPLKLNDEVYGVIELAAFEVFEKYVVDFVEKIGVTIASTISTTKVNIKTKQLLEASKMQADELASQEEEMRQNMEELIATQEESARKSKEFENLMASISTSSYIFEYDIDGYVITANDSILSLLGIRRENLIGLNIKEIDSHVNEHFNDFWNKLKRGFPAKIKSTIKGQAQKVELFQTFIPVADDNDKVYKIMVIAHCLDEYEQDTSGKKENKKKISI